MKNYYPELADDCDDYSAMYEVSPKRRIFKFDLLKTFQRGFSLSSFIGAVIYLLRYFAR